MTRQVLLWVGLFPICGCNFPQFDPTSSNDTIDTMLTVVPSHDPEPPVFSLADKPVLIPISQRPNGPAIAERFRPPAPEPYPNQITVREAKALAAVLDEEWIGCGIGRLEGEWRGAEWLGYGGNLSTTWYDGPVTLELFSLATDHGSHLMGVTINRQEYRRESLNTNILTWRRTRPER